MSQRGFDGLQRRSCTSVLVGRAATRDGSIIIARNEDNTTPAAPKSLRVVPKREGGQRELVSGANGFAITLPECGMRYTAMPDVTPEDGLFEEAGVNAAHVAMSSTESALANSRVLAFDPYVENGLAEDAMLTAVLPYVRTAREGVERLGRIVAESGSAESNGVLFADHTEAWYMEIATGHHWVAQRIPDDCVAVVANQLSIQQVDFDSDDFMYSDGIREFVEEHSLNPSKPAGFVAQCSEDLPKQAASLPTFNFREIFGTSSDGDRRYNTPRVWDGLRLLAPEIAMQHELTDDDMPFVFRPNRLLGVEDVAAVLSSHFDETVYDPIGTAGDEFSRKRYRAIALSRTQESHVLQLEGVFGLTAQQCADAAFRGELASPVCWVALGTPCYSPYMPLFCDVDAWPECFDNATPKPDLSHAYWVFRSLEAAGDARAAVTNVRVSDYKDEQWQKALRHAERVRRQAAEASAGDKRAIYTQANDELAEWAVSDARKQLAELLLDLSVASPLTFKMNPNL